MLINTIDGINQIDFYQYALIHQDDEKLIFLIESKSIPDDDNFIFQGETLQVIWGSDEDIHGKEIKEFYFMNEIAGATTLVIYTR